MKTSDEVLVRATLDGDKEAFGQLYDRYARLIRAVCYDVTGDVAQAQDLAQEVFLRAFSRLDKLKDSSRFGPWLVSMAKNIGREYRRGKFRDRHVYVGLQMPQDQAADEVVKDDLTTELDSAMLSLSEKERLALHVYYLQGQDAEQTRKILGVSRSGLFRLLDKAKKNLQKYLSDNASK